MLVKTKIRSYKKGIKDFFKKGVVYSYLKKTLNIDRKIMSVSFKKSKYKLNQREGRNRSQPKLMF